MPRRRTVRLLRGPLPSGCTACTGLGRRLPRAPSLQALLQRVHQADHVARALLTLRQLDRLAAGLPLDQRLQRVLILILEFAGVEMRGLALEDVTGELDHVLRDLRALDVVEELVLVTQLVGIAQRGAEQALAER